MAAAAPIIAAVLPFLLEKLFPGKKEKTQQFQNYTPGQMDILSQLTGGMQGVGGSSMDFLKNLMSGDTSKFEAPLMRQFNEQVIPGIAERFSGMGGGAQQSSAFGQQLGAAGAGLTEQLGALRGGLQMQGLNAYSGLLGQILGARPFENVFRPATQGMGGAMAPGIGQGIGQSIGGADYSKLWDLLKNMMPKH
jgi:hypothetical protein